MLFVYRIYIMLEVPIFEFFHLLLSQFDMGILLIIIILQLIVLVALIVSQSKTAKSLRELEKLLKR